MDPLVILELYQSNQSKLSPGNSASNKHEIFLIIKTPENAYIILQHAIPIFIELEFKKWEPVRSDIKVNKNDNIHKKKILTFQIYIIHTSEKNKNIQDIFILFWGEGREVLNRNLKKGGI